MNNAFLILLCLSFLFSCSPKAEEYQTPEEFVASLPQVMPEKIVQLNSLDSLYFEFLGIQSIPIDNGSFLLPEWQKAKILLVDAKGSLQKIVNKNGRGPGEVLDVSSAFVETSIGGFVIYDGENRKAVVFDSTFKFQNEFLVNVYKEASVVRIFPTHSDVFFIAALQRHDYRFSPQGGRDLLLARYNSETGIYTKVNRYDDKHYARQMYSGLFVGGAAVPFAPSTQFIYQPETGNYYLFWTNSDEIAVVNGHFDTLRTIPVNLPHQSINQAELDSISNEYPDDEYPTMDKLLTELKSPVRNMLVDHKNRIWLHLNYRGENEKWVILNQKGKPQKMIILPEDSWLTHVSSYHLGVRLNAYTFALFEPVK